MPRCVVEQHRRPHGRARTYECSGRIQPWAYAPHRACGTGQCRAACTRGTLGSRSAEARAHVERAPDQSPAAAQRSRCPPCRSSATLTTRSRQHQCQRIDQIVRASRAASAALATHRTGVRSLPSCSSQSVDQPGDRQRWRCGCCVPCLVEMRQIAGHVVPAVRGRVDRTQSCRVTTHVALGHDYHCATEPIGQGRSRDRGRSGTGWTRVAGDQPRPKQRRRQSSSSLDLPDQTVVEYSTSPRLTSRYLTPGRQRPARC